MSANVLASGNWRTEKDSLVIKFSIETHIIQLKKIEKDLNRHFSKEDMQMAKQVHEQVFSKGNIIKITVMYQPTPNIHTLLCTKPTRTYCIAQELYLILYNNR